MFRVTAMLFLGLGLEFMINVSLGARDNFRTTVNEMAIMWIWLRALVSFSFQVWVQVWIEIKVRDWCRIRVWFMLW